MNLWSWLSRLWSSFSYTGLVTGTLFFAASLSPSLLPRNFLVQGFLSGFALAVGYGIGVGLVWLYRYTELRQPGAGLLHRLRQVTTIVVVLITALSLWRATVWQDSIRKLMEMPPLTSTYAPYVALIALLVATMLIGLAAIVRASYRAVNRQLSRLLPPRLSRLASAVVVVILVLVVTNRIVARHALRVADRVFLQIDQQVDEEVEQPTDPRASGSPDSLVDWETIGRQGKNFIAAGPTEKDISQFWGGPAKRPLRVYVGLGSADSPEARAELALKELIRVGGFERPVLVVATPTGTGWLDPNAVDSLEYLHRGDTAIVSMQYSYLPSWITILVDPQRSKVAAKSLFNQIYGHWKTLPRETRPKLYLHGLSLGAFGSESCADLFTLFEHPIQGGVWSGPPFPSSGWRELVRGRNPGSPAWLPTFRDGAMVRFTGRENSLAQAGDRWGPMRFVYIQHASDPMSFFSPDLLLEKPAWLSGKRGPDVSPYLTWFPVVTFLQVAFDLPMATSVPLGYGHNYASASYIGAWTAVTEPPDCSVDDTLRLQQLFADQQVGP